MKTYKEMADSVLRRSGEILLETQQKRKRRAKLAAVVTGCCAAVLIGAVSVHSGLWQFTAPGDIAALPTAQPTRSTRQPDDPSKLGDDPPVFGDGTSADEGMTDWNGKTVQLALLDAFDRYGEERVYAVTAQFIDTDPAFVYRGKTLGEYEADWTAEQATLDKLHGLLKVGEALQYGEALYQTGTPDGEKWSQELYEETVAFYGADFLGKYIADGRFVRERVEADIAAFRPAAETAYREAAAAYRENVLAEAEAALSRRSVEWVRSENRQYLILAVTPQELSALSLSHLSGWVFGLEVRDNAADLAVIPDEI